MSQDVYSHAGEEYLVGRPSGGSTEGRLLGDCSRREAARLSNLLLGVRSRASSTPPHKPMKVTVACGAAAYRPFVGLQERKQGSHSHRIRSSGALRSLSSNRARRIARGARALHRRGTFQRPRPPALWRRCRLLPLSLARVVVLHLQYRRRDDHRRSVAADPRCSGNRPAQGRSGWQVNALLPKSGLRARDAI